MLTAVVLAACLPLEANEPRGTTDEQNKRKPRVLSVPKDHASVAEAMQAARPGDVVDVAAGEYKGSVALAAGVTLRGAGSDQTVLWADDWTVITAENVTGAILQGLRLNGRFPEGSDHHVVWAIDAGLTIRECHLRGATWSSVVAKGKSAELEVIDSVIENNGQSGILVLGGARAVITRSRIRDNGMDGVSATNAGTRVSLEANVITNNRERGIFIRDGAHARIERNQIRGNEWAGLYIADARSKLLALDNTLAENARSGVFIANQADARIERNQIRGNELSGITIDGAGTNPLIVDNTVVENRQSGLVARNASRGRIERNTFADNGYHGVAALGAKSSPTLRHNVMFRNGYDGVWVFDEAAANIVDNIVLANQRWGISAGGPHLTSGSPQARHNVLHGNGSGAYELFDADATNLVADPRVSDADNYDFRLAPDSPARGAGVEGDDVGLYPRMAPPSTKQARADGGSNAGDTPPAVPNAETTRVKGEGDAEATDKQARSVRLQPRSRTTARAVVVGVQAYRSKRVTNLRYAGNDANQVAAFLRGKGYDVKTLIDRRADLVSLRAALLWLADTGRDGRAVFFFSGHGSNAANPLAGGTGFLLPWDADPGRLAATALPLSELQSAVRYSDAQRFSVLLDTCFAGGADAKSISPPRSGTKDDGITGRLVTGRGKVALYSSKDNEVSAESPKYRHGYFTHHLLAAWRAGKQAADAVYRHVYDQVVKDTHGQQHPMRASHQAEGDVPIY